MSEDRGSHSDEVLDWIESSLRTEDSSIKRGLRLSLWVVAIIAVFTWALNHWLAAEDSVPILVLTVTVAVFMLVLWMPHAGSRKRLGDPAAIAEDPTWSDPKIELALSLVEGNPRVTSFLRRLQLLRAEHWQVVASRSRNPLQGTTERYWRWGRNHVRELEGYDVDRLDPVVRSLDALVDCGVVPFEPPYAEYRATKKALMAILYSEKLGPAGACELYRPFESLITYTSLTDELE